MNTMPKKSHTSDSAQYIVTLDPARVKPFDGNPRKRFRGIDKLAESIRLVGQVTPILVTACKDPDYDAELVDGERRLRACLQGGMRVRVVFEDVAAADRYLRSVAANFCRQGHDAVEIMEAVLAMKDAGRTPEESAAIFGKTASWVAQYASLRRLAPAVLKKLQIAGDEAKLSKAERRARGRMTLSIALLLVGLPEEQQVKVLARIIGDKMSMVQARTYVYRVLKQRARSGARAVAPRKQFQALSTAIQNCMHVVERYVSMPGAEIGPMLRNVVTDERKRLSKQLETLCDGLLMLADALEGTGKGKGAA